MSSETIQIILACAYVITTIVGVITIGNLNSTIQGQNTLITNIKTYTDILNAESFAKHVETIKDIERTKTLKEANTKLKEFASKYVDETRESFAKQINNLSERYNELSGQVIYSILQSFPSYADKERRDKVLLQNFPQNAEILISSIDEYQLSKDLKL